MYNEKIENLIKAALADGVLTEKEKQVLFKKAYELGIDLDEFEMVLDARLFEAENAAREKRAKAAPNSGKYADVKKCPACGTIIPPNTKVCPGCGMVFNNDNSDIKEILQLQDNYVKICKVKPTFPKGPLYLSLCVPILLLNILSWIYSFEVNLGWLGLAIPVTVITIILIIVRFHFYDEAGESKKETFSVYDSQYYSLIGEHQKLRSTAQSFYAQDKSIVARIDEVDNKVKETVSKNDKTNKVYLSLSYGTLAFTIILALVLSFGWFSKSLDIHSVGRADKLIEKALIKGEIEKAETYFNEFIGTIDQDWELYALANRMIQYYIEVDNEERILHYAKYRTSRYDNYYLVCNYYISKERYQDAVNIYGNLSDIYNALERCVKELVRKNKKSEAINLIKTNSYHFNNEDADSYYAKNKVVKMLIRLTQD